MATVEEGVNTDQYTQDGTVGLKGNPVLRSKRGGWTACSFVVGNSLSLSLLHVRRSHEQYVSFHAARTV